MSKKPFAFASGTRKPRRESPAKRRLLDAAIQLLGKLRPSEITTTMVLKEAGVARNTLYLHFENQAALIESALLSIFLDGVYQNADMLEKSLKQSRNKPDFLRHAEKIIRVSQDPDRRAFRIARCRLIALAEKNPRFAKILGAEQNLVNERFTRLFAEMHARGWLNSEITPAAATILVQAITLGRIVDDVASKKVNEKAWRDTYMSVVKKVILSH